MKRAELPKWNRVVESKVGVKHKQDYVLKSFYYT